MTGGRFRHGAWITISTGHTVPWRTRAAEIAQCNTAYTNRVNGPCNIRCNSYTDCRGSYGRFDPRRYTCLAARAACVAGAAVARGACIAESVVERAACKVLAEAKMLACKAGVVLRNIVCSTVETGKAIGNTLVVDAHVALAGGAAAAALGQGGACALGETFRAGLDLAAAAGHGRWQLPKEQVWHWPWRRGDARLRGCHSSSPTMK